jgi:hypothetical protein
MNSPFVSLVDTLTAARIYRAVGLRSRARVVADRHY